MLDIQRARWALEKFENKFNENPSFVASGTVMKQLLDIYKECKSIDEVMGTRHFDEEHFDGLVEKVKARSGRLGNAQLAMAEHVSRMFSETSPAKSEEAVADGKEEAPEKEKDETAAAAAAPTSSGNEAAVAWQKAEGERAEKDDREICLKMLSLMKQQLLKAHGDMQVRLGITGGQEAIFSPEDLAETNEEASSDLEGIMSSILGATRQHIQRQLVALFSPLAEFASISSVEVVDPPTQNGAAPSPMNDSGPKNMDVDGEGSAAPSGVTSEDISKALYGSAPREASDKKDGDGPEKEKSQDSKKGSEDAAAAGPSDADRSKSDNNENEEEGKSICDSGLSVFLSVCQLGGKQCRMVSPSPALA